MQPTKVRIDKKVNTMAEPTGNQLANTLKTLFQTEGPESGGTYFEIPSYESNPGGRLDMFKQIGEKFSPVIKQNPSKSGIYQGIADDIKKRTEGADGLGIFLDDPFKSSELEFAKREIIKNAGLEDLANSNLYPSGSEGMSLTKKKILEDQASQIEDMPNNSAAFDESGLDQIAATLAEAQKPSFFNAGDAMAAGQAGAEKASLLDSSTSKGPDDGLRGGSTKNIEEEAFIAGMEDYIKAARGESPTGPKKKTIDQYKEEFSKATGIDVSGKVDKSQALMSFGLALMQNKAGKGFNLGKMLSGIGVAGEAAMPELAAARKEAKQASLSAGKFALEMQSSDESKRKAAAEKAMNRTQYYVMPKGEGVGGFIKNMDKAKSQRLNVFELNALTTNPEFDENYEIISASSYTDLAKKALEVPEAKDLFAKTKTDLNLLGNGADPMFTLSIFDVNPNNENAPDYGKISGGAKAHEPVYRALATSLKSLNAEDAKLAKAVALAEGGAATTPEMILNWAKGVGNKFGFEIKGNTPTDQLNFFLNKLAVENAAEILGESGKTLSDADRGLVKSLIGQLTKIGGDNPDEIAAKLREFREKIIVKKRNDILNAYRNLDGYARQDTSDLWGDGDWSESDEAELIKLRKSYSKEK